MFETAGATTILEPAPLILALVLLPLLGLAAGLAGPARHAARVAIAASGGFFAVAVALAFRLAVLPPGRALVLHGPPLARIGQLDVVADLVVDAPSVALLVLTGALALSSALHAAWTSADARLPWIQLLVLAVAFVATADALPLVAAGFALSTVAAWGLSRGTQPGAIGALVAGDAAIAFGVAALFWAPGGTFGPAGYTPDGLPRFAIIMSTNAAAPEGKATVALTTYAGSLVVADDGPPLPGEPLRAPFVATLDPGTYSFRIQAGVASQDALVSHVALASGRAYVLAPFGPSVSVRNLGEQARIPRPALAGERSLRSELASPTQLGLHGATLLAVLLFGGALVRLARVVAGRALVVEALPVLLLAFRLAPAVDAGHAFALTVAIGGALLAARACAEPETHAALGSVLGANVAVAVAVLLGGEPGAALVIAVAALLAAEAWRVADDGAGDVRWLGVACAASSGVIPAAGASTGFASAVGSALAAGQLALAVTVLATVALGALAAFRVYDASIIASRRGGSRAVRGLAAVLAVLAIVAGAALGAGTSPFGGRVVPLVRRVVSGGVPLDNMANAANAARVAAGAFAATVAAAAAGVATSRRAARLPWLGAPVAALALAGVAAGRFIRFLSRGARALDREVIEDLTVALGGSLVRAGAAVRRLDVLFTVPPLDRAADAALARMPRLGSSAERVRRGILFGMVALLALVVLSSLVLGR